MADNQPPPPPADFSELVTQWERTFNELSNQVMGTDEFSRNLNQWQNMQLEFQRNFSEAMAKQLANFNMPSRADVIAIAEHLQAIDARLIRIEKALAKTNTGFEDVRPKASAPRRTRKPPSADPKAKEG